MSLSVTVSVRQLVGSHAHALAIDIDNDWPIAIVIGIGIDIVDMLLSTCDAVVDMSLSTYRC